jgi:hypothetical protein
MASANRIAEAVNNEEWQEFRLSLKGLLTDTKLIKLHNYWTGSSQHAVCFQCEDHIYDMCIHCDICLQVDNYIKALCRGGQLYPGESLRTALRQNWKLKIRR